MLERIEIIFGFNFCHKTTGTTKCCEIKYRIVTTHSFPLLWRLIFILRGECFICISSATGAPPCTWMIGWHFFFFLLRRKLCIDLVSQVWGYYLRLPNEWVMGTNRCCSCFDANETHTKFPRSTFATRAISLLSPIILTLQMFFSRVLLRRQQVFSPGNFARQRPKTRTTTIKGQVFVFRYERVNSKRKFTIVAEIVFLLKKIYKGDVLCRAVFKVKTLAVLFSPYPRGMKTSTAKFKSAAILTLTCFYRNCVTRSHARPNRASVA